VDSGVFTSTASVCGLTTRHDDDGGSDDDDGGTGVIDGE